MLDAKRRRVTLHAMTPFPHRSLLLLAIVMLAGCASVATESTNAAAGIAGSAVARTVTKDPAVTTGIGFGFLAGANAGLGYVERRVHGYEQDRIAEAAGRLGPDAVGDWSVKHDIPTEPDEHGQVAVVRDFGADSFRCKEIVFSVDGSDQGQHQQPPHRSFYTANICLDGTRWRWASAEPATERWGALQ